MTGHSLQKDNNRTGRQGSAPPPGAPWELPQVFRADVSTAGVRGLPERKREQIGEQPQSHRPLISSQPFGTSYLN